MASTAVPPPAPPVAPAPAAAPPAAAPSLAERLTQRVEAAKAERAAATPPAPAPVAAPTTPEPGVTPPPASATPGEGEAAAPPVPKSIDEIDLENLAEPTVQPGQPAVVAVPDATSPDDPLTLATKMATALGITPEILTTTPEGRQMLSAVRWRSAIEAPPTEDGRGGLGYLPAATEVTDAFQAAAAMDAFELAFESRPEDAALFLTAPDFNPQTGKYSLRPGAMAFLESLPGTLDKLGKVRFQNGQEVSLLYHAARPFLARAADEMYDAANAEGITPEDKAARIQAARIFEKSFFNKDRMARQANEPDDIRQTRERQAAEDQRRATAQKTQADQMGQHFSNAVLSTANSRIEAAVDKLLADTGTAQNIPAYALPSLRNQIIEDAINLTSGNTELGIRPVSPLQYQRWSNNLERWTATARLTVRRDGVKALSDAYYNLAMPNIKSAFRRVVSQQVSAAAQANGAVHADARLGAARVEPGGPGTPKAQSVVAAPAGRQENESIEDYGSRLIRDKLTLARSQNQPVRR